MAKTLDWIKAHYDRVALLAAGLSFLFLLSPFGGTLFSSEIVW